MKLILKESKIDYVKEVENTIDLIKNKLDLDLSDLKIRFQLYDNNKENNSYFAGKYLSYDNSILFNANFEGLDDMNEIDVKNCILLTCFHELRHMLQHKYLKKKLTDHSYTALFKTTRYNNDKETLLEKDAHDFSVKASKAILKNEKIDYPSVEEVFTDEKIFNYISKQM